MYLFRGQKLVKKKIGPRKVYVWRNLVIEGEVSESIARKIFREYVNKDAIQQKAN